MQPGVMLSWPSPAPDELSEEQVDQEIFDEFWDRAVQAITVLGLRGTSIARFVDLIDVGDDAEFSLIVSHMSPLERYAVVAFFDEGE